MTGEVDHYHYTYDRAGNAYGEVTYYNADWTEKAVQTSSVGNTRLFAGMDHDSSTGMYWPAPQKLIHVV